MTERQRILDAYLDAQVRAENEIERVTGLRYAELRVEEIAARQSIAGFVSFEGCMERWERQYRLDHPEVVEFLSEQ